MVKMRPNMADKAITLEVVLIECGWSTPGPWLTLVTYLELDVINLLKMRGVPTKAIGQTSREGSPIICPIFAMGNRKKVWKLYSE